MGLWRRLNVRIQKGDRERSRSRPGVEHLEPRVLLSGYTLAGGAVQIPFADEGAAIEQSIQSGTPAAVSCTTPQAADDSRVAYEDHLLTVCTPGVLSNDADAGGGQLEAVKVADPAHGQVTLNPDGSFVYSPEADWWGRDTFTYKASDGQADSNTATVTVLVCSVNDAPSFACGSNVAVSADAGPQTFAAWATAISPGPANESGQDLTFLLTCDHPTLFSVQPVISADGTLTFTSARDACGVATVTVRLKDSGGTANGGVDTSLAKSFNITVSAVHFAPVLDSTAGMCLSPILQGDLTNTGTLVADILKSGGSDRITDIVADGLEGIAVIGVDNSSGTWQFSTNGGVNWTAFGSPSPSQARLLAADRWTRVRWVPGVGFSGTVDSGITLRAWDRTAYSNGDTANATTCGGSTVFSAASGTAAIVVKPAVRLPGGKGTNDVVVRRSGDNLQVVNAQNQVLFSKPLSSLTEFTVVGAANKADTVTVDLAAGGGFVLPEGLVFEGGSGSQTDTLVVRGTSGADYCEIHTDYVVVKGLLCTFSGTEQVRVEGGSGDDSYVIFGLGVPTVLCDSSGIDLLNFSYTLSAVSIDLSKSSGQWQKVLSGTGVLALKGTFENVMGTTWSDLIIGNSASNRIWGWCGDDTIYGGGGDDWLYGQAGSDRLFGGEGNDVLLGAEGNDQLDGGAGSDLVIGGLGKDSLTGSSGDDILIGGTTNCDNDPTALRTIMAEWTATRSLATRIDHLSNGRGLNGAYVLRLGQTVCDDRGCDVLLGGSGSDWFLCFYTDSLTDRTSQDR